MKSKKRLLMGAAAGLLLCVLVLGYLHWRNSARPDDGLDTLRKHLQGLAPPAATQTDWSAAQIEKGSATLPGNGIQCVAAVHLRKLFEPDHNATALHFFVKNEKAADGGLVTVVGTAKTKRLLRIDWASSKIEDGGPGRNFGGLSLDEQAPEQRDGTRSISIVYIKEREEVGRVIIKDRKAKKRNEFEYDMGGFIELPCYAPPNFPLALSPKVSPPGYGLAAIMVFDIEKLALLGEIIPPAGARSSRPYFAFDRENGVIIATDLSVDWVMLIDCAAYLKQRAEEEKTATSPAQQQAAPRSPDDFQTQSAPNPPSMFTLGFDDGVYHTNGEFAGWHMAFRADDCFGELSIETFADRLKKTEFAPMSAMALRMATKGLARSLVSGQVRADPSRELRCVQFGYAEKDNVAGVSGLFIYSDVDDLPMEVRDLATRVKAVGFGRSRDEQEKIKEHRGRDVPITAWFRIQQRTRTDTIGARQWLKVFDVTAHEKKADCSRSPGNVEPLAFLASVDVDRFKLAVVELAARIAGDRLEGIRNDEAEDSQVQIGFVWKNVDVSAHFHYSSEDVLAKAMRAIIAEVPNEIPDNQLTVDYPEDVF